MDNEYREQINAIITAALGAVEPAAAIGRQVTRRGDTLHIGGRAYDLTRYDNLYVVGGGKASGAMAAAIEEIVDGRGERGEGREGATSPPSGGTEGGRGVLKGVVNVKDGYTAPTRWVRLCEAGHPLPDARGARGAAEMIALLERTTPRDLVLCLISGGGSALLPAPVAGVTLADLQTLTAALLRCGATINEINAVRKHLSRLKGGNLARLAAPAPVVALILSDVVGNPLDVIASGPTVPDSTTRGAAWGVLEKYDLTSDLPRAIIAHLRDGAAETPKPGDAIFAHVHNVVIASNERAAAAARGKARELGFNTMLLSTYVEGEAREVARVCAAIGKEIVRAERPLARPACVIMGGETTVTVRGAGQGGRNQELALAAAIALDGWENVSVVALATDGTDGPTDAAGAIVDGTTAARGRERGLDAGAYLRDNDAYHFFAALGDLIMTGPTNTNVNDLTLVFVF